MANVTIQVQSLLNAATYDSYTVDDSTTVANLKVAIQSATNVDPAWYSLFAQNQTLTESNTLASYGITTGTQIRSANKIGRLATLEDRQKAKLDLAALDRTASGNPRATYDITQLPNPYNDNDVDPDDNPNTGGLVTGRPWVELAAGLYRRTYSGYFGDAVLWFGAATQTAASADSTLAIASMPVTTSVQWLGYFIPATTETYTFYTTSDDASYLWVGATAVSGFTVVNAIVKNGGEHGAEEASGTIALTAGVRYAIRIQTGNNGGPGSHATNFSTPTIAKTSVFTGRIFYNPVTNGF